MRCIIESESGNAILVDLVPEPDGRAAATVWINGVPCHIEYLDPSVVAASRVDEDPDYVPQTDAEGRTYWIVPFSQPTPVDIGTPRVP